MLRFAKHTAILLALAWTAITLGVGAEFDRVCVEGRLSAEQARALNAGTWGHCPSYRDEDCVAKEKDRVFVGECSEFFKFLWQPNKWWPAIRTGEFPWQYNKAPPPS